MTRYLVKRAVSGLIALFIFATFLFFVAQLLIPGDFVGQFALGMSLEERQAWREELGLDRPLGEQYLLWLRNLFNGTLGTSYFGGPVTAVLYSAIAPTLLIFGPGTLIAFLLGLWLGKVTAWRSPKLLSGTATFSAVTFYTAFPPWLTFLMVYFFGLRLGVFRLQLDFQLWRTSPLPRPIVESHMVATLAVGTLLLIAINLILKRVWRWRLPMLLNMAVLIAGAIVSWHVLGFGPQAMSLFEFVTLPIATYVLLSFGEVVLIMQTSMRDTLSEDYVQAARAKGLPESVVRDKHAARNAVLPVLSKFAVSLPYLMTGLIMIEDAFLRHGAVSDSRMPGLGYRPGISWTLFGSVSSQDMPVVMGVLLVVGVLSLAARLILDVLSAYLDPRIRFGARAPRNLR